MPSSSEKQLRGVIYLIYLSFEGFYARTVSVNVTIKRIILVRDRTSGSRIAETLFLVLQSAHVPNNAYSELGNDLMSWIVSLVGIRIRDPALPENDAGVSIQRFAKDAFAVINHPEDLES